MDFIKELTEPKIFSDGVIRTPNALMLRAGRTLKQMKEVLVGMERSLHTTQLQVQTDIRNMDQMILALRGQRDDAIKARDTALKGLKECEYKYYTLWHTTQKPDMTEFYEINNRDRE